MIYNLANQYPFAAGDAVYAARPFYSLVNPFTAFDDEELCAQYASFKREQNSPKVKPEFNINLSPNPATNYFDVMVKGDDDELLMQIYNALGEAVISGLFTKYAEVDVHELPKGIYSLTLQNSGGFVGTAKFIVA